LLTLFAHQEIADLQSRSGEFKESELAHRLHVIFFAPAGEASTRNVVAALDLLVRHPEAVSDSTVRFDLMNGILQVLRGRWELRQNVQVVSARRQLTDAEKSVVTVEKALTAMDQIQESTPTRDGEWKSRKQVIERMLLLPLRAYRTQLESTVRRNEGTTRNIVDQADAPNEE